MHGPVASRSRRKGFTVSSPKDVFVSYDYRDKDYVSELVRVMESVGLTARTDFELPFGANFYRYMEAAVKECFAAILVISRSYVENESWARVELMELVARQVKGRVFLIPLVIDQIDLGVLPFGLQTIRHIDNSSRNRDHLQRDLLALKVWLVSYDHVGEYARPCVPAPADHMSEASERRIRVQVTNACNLRSMGYDECPWCHWDQFAREAIAPRQSKVLSILKKIKDAAKSHIYPRPRIEFTFTGGEPLADLEHLPRSLSSATTTAFLSQMV